MPRRRKETGQFRYMHRAATQPEMRIFREKTNLLSLNILSIGAGAFELEKELRRKRIGKVSLPNLSAALMRNKTRVVEQCVAELFELLHAERVKVSFRREVVPEERGAELGTPRGDAIVLFSGGTDSLAGILAAREHYESIVGVTCAHSDQSKAINLQTRLATVLKRRFGIESRKVNVPAIGKGQFAQTRGFLYILAAGAWAGVTGASKLVVSECGPTMYQPRFGPFDETTMTSHPYVLGISRRLLSSLLGRDMSVVTPFENMTKAEVLAACPVKSLIPRTHSCITQRFWQQDGTCYGCVMRRLAAVAANIRDAQYRKDPLKDASARQDNVVAILEYSLQLVDEKRPMNLYQIENMEMFDKYDLFRRFALDNLAAVYKLDQSGKRVTTYVRRIVDAARRTVGERALEKRLEVLSEGRARPVFTAHRSC